jgi:hypothetical protein
MLILILWIAGVIHTMPPKPVVPKPCSIITASAHCPADR